MRICRTSHSLSRALRSTAHTETYATKTFSSRLHHSASSKTDARAPNLLTILHKTKAIVPYALPHENNAAASVQSLEFWNNVLEETYEDCTGVSKRGYADVVVYGVDESAQTEARNLVVSLLQEPFGSDDVPSILQSHLASSNSTIIEHPALPSSTSSVLVNSSFLRQFSVPIRMTELRPAAPSSRKQAPTPSSPTIDARTFKTIMNADVAIIVCDPLTSLLPSNLPPNPKILVVYISPKSSSNSPTLGKDVIHADPARAVTAVRALRAHSGSTLAVQRYQDDFVGSGVSAISKAVQSALESTLSATSTTTSEALVARKAASKIKAALLSCSTALRAASKEIDSMYLQVSALQQRIEEAKVRINTEVFLATPERGSGESNDEVVRALKQAEQAMRIVMDRLTWWRMIWRVDEISAIVGGAVEKVWFTQLEKKLIFQTGRLYALQQELTLSAQSMVSGCAPALRSSVLVNRLNQISSAYDYGLTPSSLTHPLRARSAQLIAFPTTRLHLAGQKAVLCLGAGSGLGASIAWAGWIGTIAEYGGWFAMDAVTASGVGALTAVIGIRLAVGIWEKGKKRWWQDWRRVGDGLDRDLKLGLQTTMDERVAVVAEQACVRLQEQGKKRKETVDEISDEIYKLEGELSRWNQTLQASK